MKALKIRAMVSYLKCHFLHFNAFGDINGEKTILRKEITNIG